MNEQEKITPEYIITQIGILTEAELIELIEAYGNQEVDLALDTLWP